MTRNDKGRMTTTNTSDPESSTRIPAEDIPNEVVDDDNDDDEDRQVPVVAVNTRKGRSPAKSSKGYDKNAQIFRNRYI